MTIREDQLIERIRRRVPSSPTDLVRMGIGDDAAVVRPSRGQDWVLTCDQFNEDVHFLADFHPPEAVGYKALARATSDLAAMGARPKLFLLSMALPAHRSGRWLDRMLAGMAKAARRFGLTLAGGDTARTPPGRGARGKIAMQLTVLGEIKAGQAVLRRGARPGDALFVTGRLGAAQLGLELLLRGKHRQRRWQHLLIPHYYPAIPIELGQWLGGHRLGSGLASAMMDLSDGLSTDLTRLCRSSGVGARLYEKDLPCAAVPKQLRLPGCNALALALHGGEDYGLLFTVPKRLLPWIPPKLHGTRITRIGEIVSGRGVTLVAADGVESALEPKGWDHFRAGR